MVLLRQKLVEFQKTQSVSFLQLSIAQPLKLLVIELRRSTKTDRRLAHLLTRPSRRTSCLGSRKKRHFWRREPPIRTTIPSVSRPRSTEASIWCVAARSDALTHGQEATRALPQPKKGSLGRNNGALCGQSKNRMTNLIKQRRSHWGTIQNDRDKRDT